MFLLSHSVIPAPSGKRESLVVFTAKVDVTEFAGDVHSEVYR